MSEPTDNSTQELAPIVRRKPFVGDTEMDITPMIDCTFLLLIFFIVCSRPDAQEAIILARAHHGAAIGAKNMTVITIAESGRDTPPVYLADGKIEDRRLSEDPEQQAEQVREAVQAGVDEGKEQVLIKAERGVSHRDVARVTAAASRVQGVRIFFGVTDAE